MTAFAVVVLLLSSQAAWGAASLSGRVATRDGSRTEPVPDAYVQAKAGNPQRVVAQAETDSRGRFALQDLPAGRVTFAVEAADYYTIKAGTLDTETITRTCPEAGDCGQVDFVVAKAAVLEGWLADNFGEPVESASVSLTPASGDEGPPPQGRPVRHTAHHAMSDDRGYFRIWDIKPGRYKLVANRPPMWGPPLPLEEREIEVTGGDGPQEVRLEMKGEAEVFSVSGMIEGLTEEDLKRTTLGIQPMLPANSEGSRLWTMFTMIREGKFSFGGLKKGEYIAHLVGGQGGQRTMRLMGVLDVDQDLADLRLEPMEPTGVRGRVRFVDGEPRNLSLGAVPNGTGAGLYAQLGVEGPDYTFEHTGIPPGEYRITPGSQDYYLLEDYSFSVQRGVVTELDVAVSSEFAKVRGEMRVMGEGQARTAASHFLVAIKGDRGSQTSAADESGAFLFDRVIPGEYKIAAWRDPNTDVTDEQVWDERRTTVRTIQVKGGFETEVDLTVKP